MLCVALVSEWNVGGKDQNVTGIKLHINYLHKIVNQKANLSLSLDTVGLYLDEAINRGYCERDNYDSNCYLSVSDKKTLIEEAFRNNPYKSIRAEVKEKQKESVQLTKTVHNLPPSPKIKRTIPKTILGYLVECQPKTFTSSDIVNYTTWKVSGISEV